MCEQVITGEHVNRWTGVEGVEDSVELSKSLYIYNPTKNTFQKPASIDTSDQRHYYTVVYGSRIDYMAHLVYVHYYTIVYGSRIDYMGTRKPHVVGVWLNSMFVI